MRFTFTGRFGYNDLESKTPYLREGKSKAGNYKSLSFYVKTDTNDIAFIEMFGINPENGMIKTSEVVDGKFVPVEVSWLDRFDKDVVSNISSTRKNIVNLGEKHEYISSIDAIDEIVDKIKDLEGKMVTVTGSVTKNFYNGKTSNRFTMQNIFFAKEGTKTALQIKATEFFRPDDIDMNDWKEEKKIYLNGFTSEYVTDKKENYFVPQCLIFDASKVGTDDAKSVKKRDFILKYLGISNNNGKMSKAFKKSDSNKVFSMAFITKFVNGAEEVEFDETCLTEDQKEAIELGFNTIDDFRKGKMFGDRITEMRIMKPDLNGDYNEGMIEAAFSVEEFEDKIYTGAETSKKMDEAAIEEPEESIDDAFEDDDIFG